MDRTQADDDRPATPKSALSQEDEQRALDHKLDRLAPSRRAVWPKDDRRSSELVEDPAAHRAARPTGELPQSEGERPLQ
jgi:hypothetical protein